MKNWRINFVLFALIIVGAAIMGRLFYLQVYSHKIYKSLSLGQQVGFSEVEGKRGEIYFQNSQGSRGAYGSGEIKSLAINKELWILGVFVDEIEDKKIFSEKVSEVLKESYDFIFSKIDNKKGYLIIKKNLSDLEKNELQKLKLKGIRFNSDYVRYYPQEKMASHIIGFLGGDGRGQYGIEGYYDEILKGRIGIKEQKRGINFINNDIEENLNGSDIYLTIDYNIQYQAESLLLEAKENTDIDSGQIIVLKPDTGRILAMANFPFFNLNNYSKEKDISIFQNSCIQKIFEPGSVVKPFTMSIAINENKITPQTTYLDNGFLKIGSKTIYNYARKKYDLQTMTEVLEKSINTGAVFAQKSVDNKIYLDYLDKLGFNKKTGIDLQGEFYSENKILKQAREINLATSSFGQGIEMTPIQLVTAFTSLANDGKMVKPYIVEKIVNDNDEKIITPVYSSQIFSSQTISQINTMLTSVIDNGFGKLAQVKGYYLSGKTGTAEVPIQGGVGYYTDKTIQSFIGFGPSLRPEFLILVKLDNPKVSASSLSAAPIFSKLANYILNYWHIPPDYEIQK